MENIILIAFLLVLLLVLLGSGVWVGLALIGVGAITLDLFTNRQVGDAMAITMWASSSLWSLTALPLFIWMGEILFRTNISKNLFSGLAPWVRNLPGGLLHVNIIGCAVFAAISGSSAATVATVGKMSIPELRERKYPDRMIMGTLAGAGTLGLLIPPSIILIIYGVTVNESIVKLFMAGVVPGVLLALLFMGYLVGWSLANKKSFAEVEESKSDLSRWQGLMELAPAVSLIIFVLGSIYFGIATATEAAVFGVVGALIISAFQRTLTVKMFRESVLHAAQTSCMIALILAGSAVLSLAMGFTGLPRTLAEMIGSWNLSPLALIAVLAVFYIILGCFLDGISTVVLTMAVIEPMVRAAGFDMIWFGVFLVIVVEMAQITPPIGFNLFVLQGMANRDIGYVAKAALPMFLVMIVALVLIVVFPGLVTALPNAMAAR